MSLVELKKQSAEVQDFMKITHHFRGIYGRYPHSIKEEPKDVNMMLNWLGLETLEALLGKNRQLVPDEPVKFETSVELPIILEESIEYTSNE